MPPSTPSTGRSILMLLGFLLLCFAVAGLGAQLAAPAIPTWYAHLNKPRFTPPNEIFAPVWSILYAMMAVSAWLVARAPRRRGRSGSLYSAKYAGSVEQGSARLDALIVFYIQLAANLAWTYVFFHEHRLLVSAVGILVLWIALFFTILLFWRVRALAGVLLLPYLAWISFATALNLVLLRLN